MIEILQCIVLRSEDLGEFDKRLTLYSRELGKLKAKIVGVRKSVSKLRSLAIPLTESRLQVYLHGGRRSGPHDPGKVIGGEILASHAFLREDWERMIQASALCEILETLTHPGSPNPKEYDLLAGTLRQMETTANPLLLRHKFSLMLLKLLGYSLRHHAVWKNYSESEQNLLRQFGEWDNQSERFSEEERSWIERITAAYLALYLPNPLKTDLFRQKLASQTA